MIVIVTGNKGNEISHIIATFQTAQVDMLLYEPDNTPWVDSWPSVLWAQLSFYNNKQLT